jgi:hypothetical protein
VETSGYAPPKGEYIDFSNYGDNLAYKQVKTKNLVTKSSNKIMLKAGQNHFTILAIAGLHSSLSIPRSSSKADGYK